MIFIRFSRFSRLFSTQRHRAHRVSQSFTEFHRVSQSFYIPSGENVPFLGNFGYAQFPRGWGRLKSY